MPRARQRLGVLQASGALGWKARAPE